MEREVAAQPLGGLAPSHRRGRADGGGLRRRRRACCATTASCSARCTRASRVELFPDEGEGYYLNLTSRRAGVVRRLAHRRRRPVARLARDGQRCRTTKPGRWLDAQERVDNVPLPRRVARLAAGLHRRALQARAEAAQAAGVVPARRSDAASEALMADRAKAASCRAGRGARRRCARAARPPTGASRARPRAAAPPPCRAAPVASAAAAPPAASRRGASPLPNRRRRWTTSRG